MKKYIFYKYVLPKFTCINCNNIIPWKRIQKLFCSDLCRDEADYVRYHRKAINENRQDIPEVRDAIEARKLSVISGGYPSKKRKIPKLLREKILKLANHQCAVCKKKGNEIDHIKGSSNDLNNLQVLCWNCHISKTKKNYSSIKRNDPDAYQKILKHIELEKRVKLKKPLVVCDDHNKWNVLYKEIQNERKLEFYKSVSNFLIKNEFSKFTKEKIALQLNALLIPTYSGSGKWDRKLVGQKLYSN